MKSSFLPGTLSWVLATIMVPLAPVAFGAESTQVIEEVVVTARYREESAQDTPISMTAFNQNMLEAITAQDLRDVGPQSPNVRIQANTFAPNSSTIHVRGMGSLTIESTNELRNGVSINGVYISRPVATLVDFFDVDTVEVLRGPQGTTFGKNSLSGALNWSIISSRTTPLVLPSMRQYFSP